MQVKSRNGHAFVCFGNMSVLAGDSVSGCFNGVPIRPSSDSGANARTRSFGIHVESEQRIRAALGPPVHFPLNPQVSNLQLRRKVEKNRIHAAVRLLRERCQGLCAPVRFVRGTQMERSRLPCSIILVIASVRRRSRPASCLTSTTGPIPSVCAVISESKDLASGITSSSLSCLRNTRSQRNPGWL